MGYWNFSNINANDVYYIRYTNLFLTNASRSRNLVFNNFKYYSGKIIKIIIFLVQINYDVSIIGQVGLLTFLG